MKHSLKWYARELASLLVLLLGGAAFLAAAGIFAAGAACMGALIR